MTDGSTDRSLPVRLADAWLRQASRAGLARGIARLAGVEAEPTIRRQVRIATDGWLIDILQSANRPIPETLYALTDDEALFVRFVAGSEQAFARTCDITLAALQGESLLDLITGGRRQRTVRILEFVTRLAGQSDLPPGDLDEFLGGHVARLLAFSRRAFEPALSQAVATSAAVGITEHFRARVIRDFETLCLAAHAEPIDAVVADLVSALTSLPAGEMTSMLLGDGVRAICHLPPAPMRARALDRLLAGSVDDSPARDVERLKDLWKGALDLLWTDGELLRTYVDTWNRLGTGVPAEHVDGLGRATVMTVVPQVVDILLSPALDPATPAYLLMALSRTGADLGAALEAELAARHTDTERDRIVETAYMAQRMWATYRGLRGAPASYVSSRSRFPEAIMDVAETRYDLGEPRVAARAAALLAVAPPNRLLRVGRRLLADDPERADVLIATAGTESGAFHGRVLATVLERTGDIDLGTQFLRWARTGGVKPGVPAYEAAIQETLTKGSADDTDEQGLAVSLLGDPLVGRCCDWIGARSVRVSRGRIDHPVALTYIEALMTAPQVDARIAGLAIDLLGSDTISAAAIDGRILLGCPPTRARAERDAVATKIRSLLDGHRPPPRALATPAVVDDFTGNSPRQVFGAITLMGLRSTLDSDEATFLVDVAVSWPHPWITCVVALVLCSQRRLDAAELSLLVRLLRRPSLVHDTRALGVQRALHFVPGRAARREADFVPGAHVTVLCVVALAVGSLLSRYDERRVVLPAGGLRALETSLAKLGETGLRASARLIVRREWTEDLPRFLAVPLGLAGIRREILDPAAIARSVQMRRRPAARAAGDQP